MKRVAIIPFITVWMLMNIFVNIFVIVQKILKRILIRNVFKKLNDTTLFLVNLISYSISGIIIGLLVWIMLSIIL